MNDRSDSNATTEHPERKVDGLIGGGHTVAMVMTMVGQSHSSRPVTCVEAVHGRLSFLVSREVDWVRDIVAGHAVVHVTVADDKAKLGRRFRLHPTRNQPRARHHRGRRVRVGRERRGSTA
jgi:hypothetical protein